MNARRRRLRRRLILLAVCALALAPLFVRFGGPPKTAVETAEAPPATPAVLPEYGDRLVLKAPEPSDEPTRKPAVEVPPAPAVAVPKSEPPAIPPAAPARIVQAPEAAPTVASPTPAPPPEAVTEAAPSAPPQAEPAPPPEPVTAPVEEARQLADEEPPAAVPLPRPVEMVEQAPVPEGPTEIPAEEAADPVAAGETGQELALVAPEPRIEMDAHAAPVVTPPGPRPRLPPDEPPAMRPGSGTIALIIDDVGPAPAWSRRALALPGPLTMAFLPYADDLNALTAQARSRGHDIFLHMPMQPIGREDPGPNALLDGMDAATLRQRLTWAIGRVSGAIGMNNHMGSRLTAEPEAMATVMDVLREHDLAFVDSRTSPRSVADGAAEKAGIAHVGRDVFLDHFPGSAFVRRQLAEVERQARTNGSVVAIGHPLPATLEVLESWIPAAKARGFRFVGVSRIIADRTCTKAPRPGCPSELTRVAAKATAP